METLLLSQEITTDSIYEGKPQNIVNTYITLDENISEYTATITENTSLLIDTSKLDGFYKYNCEFTLKINSEGDYVLNLQDCDVQQIQLYRGVSILKITHVLGIAKWLVDIVQLGSQIAEHVLPSSSYDLPYNSYGIATSTQTSTTQGIEVFNWLASETTANASNKYWTWTVNEIPLFTIFPAPFILSKFYIHVGTSTSVNYPTSVNVYGSNDYNQWTQVYSGSLSYSTAQEIKELTPTIQKPYRVYKFVLSATNANLIVLPISIIGYKCPNIGNVKFYRYPKIATSTSGYSLSINDNEGGIGSTNHHELYALVNTDNTYFEYNRTDFNVPWKITYTLPSPVRFEGFLSKSYNTYKDFYCNGWFKWEGSNDGTNWTRLCELTNPFGDYYINNMWLFYMCHTQGTYDRFRITIYTPTNMTIDDLLVGGLFPIYTIPDEYRQFDTIVPTMASNSQDGYTVSASSTTEGYAYYMYDNNSTTYCKGTISEGQWITLIDMGESVTIKGFQLQSSSANYANMPITFSIQGSADNDTWQLLQSYSLGGTSWSGYNQSQSFTLNNTTAYRYYRIVVTAVQNASTTVQICGIGWSSDAGQAPISYYELSNPTPIMHSASQDGYIVTASDTANASKYPGWKAFDGNTTTLWATDLTQGHWIQIELPEAKIENYLVLMGRTDYNDGRQKMPKNFSIKGSNDGNEWTTLQTYSDVSWVYKEVKSFEFENSTPYTYYRLDITEGYGSTQDIVIGDMRYYKRTYFDN